MEQYKFVISLIQYRRGAQCSIYNTYLEETAQFRSFTRADNPKTKEILSNIRSELKRCVNDHSFDMNVELDRYDSALHDSDYNDLLSRELFKAFFWGIYFREEVYSLQQLVELYTDTVRALWVLVGDKHIYTPVSFKEIYEYNYKNSIWVEIPPIFELIRLDLVFKNTVVGYTLIDDIILCFITSNFQFQNNNNVVDLTVGETFDFNNRLPLKGRIIYDSDMLQGNKQNSFKINKGYEPTTEIIGKIKANTVIDILEASFDGYYIHIGDNRFVHKNNIQLI